MSHSIDNKPNKELRSSEDYRFVVYRSDDFREIRSFNLSLSNIYILFSIVLLLLCGAIYSLVAFTPLRQLIPGYGQIETNQHFLELVDGVDELGVQIDAQDTYITALRTFLSTGLAEKEAGTVVELNTPSDIQMMVTEAGENKSYLSPALSTNQNNQILLAEGNELYEALAEHKVVSPVNGIVSSEFDPNIKHYGVDVLAPARTPVLSMMNGFVFSSGWDLETGYSIGIQHTNNILSFYKHNSQLLKEKGTFVAAGEAVAIIGNTGTLSNGPHVHFEIWHNGKPVNPQDILKFN